MTWFSSKKIIPFLFHDLLLPSGQKPSLNFQPELFPGQDRAPVPLPKLIFSLSGISNEEKKNIPFAFPMGHGEKPRFTQMSN